MNQAEWDACRLLYELLAVARPFMTDRQRRLFAVACCERFRERIDDARSLRALDVARLHADGRASEGERLAAEADASEAFIDVRDSRLSAAPAVPWSRQGELLAQAALLCVTPGVYYAEDAAESVRWALLAREGHRHEPAEEGAQCQILREIVGPLPVGLPRVDPLWLAYNDGAARHLAELIDREQAFDLMPVLADALEDAPADGRLIAHCRGDARHVRGCWAIDLLLGRIPET